MLLWVYQKPVWLLQKDKKRKKRKQNEQEQFDKIILVKNNNPVIYDQVIKNHLYNWLIEVKVVVEEPEETTDDSTENETEEKTEDETDETTEDTSEETSNDTTEDETENTTDEETEDTTEDETDKTDEIAEQVAVLKTDITVSYLGCIHVGYGCWGRNVLVTSLRRWQHNLQSLS